MTEEQDKLAVELGINKDDIVQLVKDDAKGSFWFGLATTIVGSLLVAGTIWWIFFSDYEGKVVIFYFIFILPFIGLILMFQGIGAYFNPEKEKHIDLFLQSYKDGLEED